MSGDDRTAPHVGKCRVITRVAVVTVVAGALGAPYLVPTDWPGARALVGAGAIGMFAPWFAMLEWLRRTTLTRVRAALWAAMAGFIVGGVRSLLVLGWALPAVEEPAIAATVVGVWVGLVHAAAAALALVLMTSRRSAVRVTAAATVPAIDWILSRTALLPIPYLTASFALSAQGGMGVLAAFGWFGLSTVSGLLGMAVAALSCRGWCGATLAVALLSVATLGLVADPPGDGIPGGRSFRILAFRSGTDLRQWNQSQATVEPQPDLIILPEEEVLMSSGPSLDVRSDTSATRTDLDDLRRRHPTAHIISGVMIVSASDESYRNSVLILCADGRETFQDKATPAPGGECVPFQNVPVLGDFFRRTFGVTGTMVTIPTERCPVHLGPLRVATAVCFEHTLLDSTTAWGTSQGEVDFLVAVAYLGRLGKAAEIDIERTEPARRLHAARLTAPVCYVTDIGVGKVTLDGHSSFTRYGPNGLATFTIEIVSRTQSRWPSIMLFLATTLAAIAKLEATA